MMAAYTVVEAAELLGVSDDTVAQLHLGTAARSGPLSKPPNSTFTLPEEGYAACRKTLHLSTLPALATW